MSPINHNSLSNFRLLNRHFKSSVYRKPDVNLGYLMVFVKKIRGNDETIKGDPILIGTVKSKLGIQEFTLPDDLPMEAKGVRIIPVESFNSGCSYPADAFVKLWSCYKDGDCQHFIFR
jgi:hypothetical protein